MDHSTECPTAGFIDISATGTNLLLADDGESSVDPLPFPILFQGTLMNNMTVGNNGGLQLGAIGAEIGYGGVFTTLPDGTMFPWGDDLDDETGNVYYECKPCKAQRNVGMKRLELCCKLSCTCFPFLSSRLEL